MKFVFLLLCIIAHFVIMVDKERIVAAVKISPPQLTISKMLSHEGISRIHSKTE